MARSDGRRPYRGVADDRATRIVRGQVNLLCGHAMFFEAPVPSVGDQIICASCRTPQHVITIEDEIRIRCRVCRYSRGYGQARLTADTYAAKHAVLRRHAVEVRKGSQILSVVGDRTSQLMLGDHPPF